MYLVSLVDAIDELLRRRVPQELNGRGVHSLHLHVLRGCSRHWTEAVTGEAQQEEAQQGEEVKKEPLAATHESQAITAPRTGKSDACFWRFVSITKKVNRAILHFLLLNSLRQDRIVD